ncbi:LacI family DNA-binding transcriptional regulator [Devosia sp.]|uniref:LacI family DNA-binding transcriptional regulator n=1 Tax=Devosia sp. TaxID=1871048 RepID=UPI003265AD69
MNKKSTPERASAPSVADVAREAGVAPSTVSRALTKPGRIAEPTRLKVEAAARKLGYMVNQAARNLRIGQTRTIMVVLPDELYIGASQTVLEVLRSAAEAMTARGYSLVIANVSREAQTDEHILSLAFGGTVSGVLLMATPVPSTAERNLMQAGLPVVSLHFDMSGQNIPSVISNDSEAIGQAVEALAGLGHTRFLHIRGRAGNYHDIERLRGVREGLTRSGISPETLQTMQGDFNFSGGVASGQLYLALALQDRPTAVVCANDDTAVGFIKTVLDGGLDVPGDVSVIGFDGASVGAFMTPSLSTVQQSTAELGRQAVELLIGMATGDVTTPPDRIEVPCQLVLRQSVRAITPEDRGHRS